MRRIAENAQQAIDIAQSNTFMGSGFPVYVIPWGMGNIPYIEEGTSFLCYSRDDIERIWEQYLSPTVVQTPSFRRAHIIHSFRIPGPK